MEERVVICENCGKRMPLASAVDFEGCTLCQDCFDQRTVVCDHCGTRIWADENAGDNYTHLCQSCYERYYVTCVRCGRVIHEDDACYEDEDSDDPLCEACYERCRNGKAIHDYYYKPVPIFFGKGPRYFGVELEIDEAGESDSNAEAILDVANGKFSHLYCKHDGSLEDGFEIVSHPMSLEYHLHQMPWAAVLNKARELGYCSHAARTCGLHLHISRDAFGTTEVQQDTCIARILYFFEKHWEELLKFSRRTPRQLERWAARYGYKEQPKDILDHAKKGYHGGRYTCVNLQNSDTIEFRMFRGTLKLNSFIATLQLVDRICDVALYLSDDELKALSWTSFVAGCTQPELVQYLKERRLYVNDPVDAAEEVSVCAVFSESSTTDTACQRSRKTVSFPLWRPLPRSEEQTLLVLLITPAASSASINALGLLT